jgi:hypothetical protein
MVRVGFKFGYHIRYIKNIKMADLPVDPVRQKRFNAGIGFTGYFFIKVVNGGGLHRGGVLNCYFGR